MREVGIDAAVVSWWGRPGVSRGDSQGILTDAALDSVLDAALGEVGIIVHLEPYEGRSVASVRADLEFLLARVGTHPALYRDPIQRPVFYVYDSYHIPVGEWKRLLTAGGDLSVRASPLDSMFLGLWLEVS